MNKPTDRGYTDELHRKAVKISQLQKGLMIQGDPTQQDHASIESFVSGMAIMAYPDLLRWRMGDAINKGKKDWGALRVKRACEAKLGITSRWVDYLSSVSKTFSEEYRFFGVSWQLYKEAASAPHPVPTLLWAIEEGLTPKQLKLRIRKAKEKNT